MSKIINEELEDLIQQAQGVSNRLMTVLKEIDQYLVILFHRLRIFRNVLRISLTISEYTPN